MAETFVEQHYLEALAQYYNDKGYEVNGYGPEWTSADVESAIEELTDYTVLEHLAFWGSNQPLIAEELFSQEGFEEGYLKGLAEYYNELGYSYEGTTSWASVPAGEWTATNVVDAIVDSGETVQSHFIKYANRLPILNAVNEVALAPNTMRLTVEEDTGLDFVGSSGDDLYDGRLGMADGQEANTLNSSDVLDGKGGTDTLDAQLIPTGTVSDGGLIVGEIGPTVVEAISQIVSGVNNPQDLIENLAELDLTGYVPLMTGPGVAIAPKTDNIEVAEFQVQAQNTDAFVNGSAIDAGEMSGVEEWWSDNSRAFLQIEDIRSNPEDTTFGMRETDPDVSYTAYFNANYVQTDEGQADSSLSLLVENVDEPDTEFEFFTVESLTFKLDGITYTIDTQALKDANTSEEFVAAVKAGLEAYGLDDVEVSDAGNNIYVLEDAQGREFEPGDINLTTEFGYALKGDAEVGDARYFDILAETNVVLDGAGNGSQGGKLNIGAMSGQEGIGQLNVLVGDDSHLVSMDTVNFKEGDQPEGYLEVVNVDSMEGADGDLTLGLLRFTGTTFQDLNKNAELPSTDGRAFGMYGHAGLTDVRELNAEDYDGSLNVAINLGDLWEAKMDSYFRDLRVEAGPVMFSYTGGNNDDIFTFDIEDNFTRRIDELNEDPEFEMEVVGGKGDDRFNFDEIGDWFRGQNLIGPNNDKSKINLDGGEGIDAVEVTFSNYYDEAVHGANDPSWKSFQNIETLIVAGTADITLQDIETGNMSGLDDIVVATGSQLRGNVDVDNSTIIRNMEEDTDVTISGRNQTLSETEFDNNVDQYFGSVHILNSEAESFTVTLENTSRYDGKLDVDSLVIDGADSQTTEVTIESAVADNRDDLFYVEPRNQVNEIDDMYAPGVSTVYLEGSQDLNLNISAMGNSTIDATGMDRLNPADTATLTLSLESEIINGTGLDEDDPNYVEVLGPNGDQDVLQLYTNPPNAQNNFAPFMTELDTTAQVSGFETIQFGDPFFTGAPNYGAYGEYDATNTTGVELYHISNVAMGQWFSLEGLGNNETVQISDLDNPIYLDAENDTSTINIDVTAGQNDSLDTIDIDGYSTINITLDDYDYTISNLNFGGDPDQVNISGEGTLTVGSLPTDQALFDMSEYDGAFTGTYAAPVEQDTTFILDEDDFELTMSGGAETFNTTFELTESTGDTNNPSEWIVNNFVDGTTGGPGNVSILDFSEFDGVDGMGDLYFDTANDTIYSQDEWDVNGDASATTWSIELSVLGADIDDLTGDNFVF